MFSRLFDLTIRPALANNPDQWESREAGRTYALEMVARISEEAARLAGDKGQITADMIRDAGNRVIKEQESKYVGILSIFCFCYKMTRLHDGR